jgi:DNA-binding MarR family transcriptional regulator
VYILLFVPEVAPAPSTCVCTTLRMASRLVTRHYDRALATTGLSTNEYAILSRLGREGDYPLGTLAARLAMDRSTLSRDIAPLVAAGLVALGDDPNDRRRRIATLTTAGTTRVEEARPLWAAAQQAFAGDFGVERTDELMHELHALVGAA